MIASLTYQPISNTRNGRFEYRSYHLTLSEEKLPKCPNCNAPPAQTELTARVIDRTYGACVTTVYLKSQRAMTSLFSTRFFEQMNLLYSGFQAGVALIQHRRFELTASCIRFQRFMLLLDIAQLARDLFAFYAELKEKVQPRDTHKFNGIFAAGCCIWAAVGTVAVVALNRFLAPTLVPKNLVMRALALPLREAENFSMSWSRGALNHMIQWTLFCRIAVNLGSIAVTKHRFSRLINSALLASTLTKITQVPWLLLSLRPAVGLPSYIRQAQAHFYYVLHPSFLHEQGAQPFQGIYEHACNYFKNSLWRPYWTYSSSGGVVTRELHFEVKVVHKKLLEYCKQAILPYFDSASGWAYHETYGWGTFRAAE